MAILRIPLRNLPQNLTTQIGSGTYQLSTFFAASPNGEGGWYLNIADYLGRTLINGIPLVTGQDLLEPYAYLNFGAVLFVATSGNPGATPTETNLGQDGGGNLYMKAS